MRSIYFVCVLRRMSQIGKSGIVEASGVSWDAEVYNEESEVKCATEETKEDMLDGEAAIAVSWNPERGASVVAAIGVEHHNVLCCYMDDRNVSRIALHGMYLWSQDYGARVQEEVEQYNKLMAAPAVYLGGK